MKTANILFDAHGKLTTADSFEFDLVPPGTPAIFHCGANEFQVPPECAILIRPETTFGVYTPVTRIQIPPDYFRDSTYFDSDILRGLPFDHPVITPKDRYGQSVLTGLQSLLDLKEKDSPAREYLEPGILYSIFEALKNPSGSI